MTTQKPETADWFNSEEYNALEACCIKGGADAGALPHFIKSLLSDQKQELLREVGEMIEGMKIKYSESTKYGVIEEGYNQALSDLQAKIKEKIK